MRKFIVSLLIAVLALGSKGLVAAQEATPEVMPNIAVINLTSSSGVTIQFDDQGIGYLTGADDLVRQFQVDPTLSVGGIKAAALKPDGTEAILAMSDGKLIRGIFDWSQTGAVSIKFELAEEIQTLAILNNGFDYLFCALTAKGVETDLDGSQVYTVAAQAIGWNEDGTEVPEFSPCPLGKALTQSDAQFTAEWLTGTTVNN